MNCQEGTEESVERLAESDAATGLNVGALAQDEPACPSGTKTVVKPWRRKLARRGDQLGAHRSAADAPSPPAEADTASPQGQRSCLYDAIAS